MKIEKSSIDDNDLDEIYERLEKLEENDTQASQKINNTELNEIRQQINDIKQQIQRNSSNEIDLIQSDIKYIKDELKKLKTQEK